MKKIIHNGTVVTPDRLLEKHSVVIEDNLISEILSDEEMHHRYNGRDITYYNANGGYIMPGIIDIHSDYIEGIVQPRPSSIMDFNISLHEAEKHLIGHGITTIYHSLSLMKESTDMDQKSIRKKENVDILVHLLQNIEKGYHLIRHRFHARYEIDNPELYDYLRELIEKGMVHELSFMDHTPGQGQYRDIEKYAKMFKQWKRINTDQEYRRFLEESKTKHMVSHEKLQELAKLAHNLHIPLASHDDDSIEKLDLIQREYKVGISEFPITMEVAKKAHEDGLYVVVGAPNIMLGGSHSGNLNAKDAIIEKYADILCSDYYPSALMNAVFLLADEGILPLPGAVKMVTLNPARAMRIEKEVGSIEKGKRADILVVQHNQSYSIVHMCFVDGNNVMQLNYNFGMNLKEAVCD